MGHSSPNNIIDLDLWILSENEIEYCNYVSGISKEYIPHCSDFNEFISGRQKFIEKMLSRNSIYVSEHASLKMEKGQKQSSE